MLKLVNAHRIDQYTETLMVFAEHSTNPVARVAVIRSFLAKVSLLLLLQVCFFRNCVILVCIVVYNVGAGNIEIKNRSTDYRS